MLETIEPAFGDLTLGNAPLLTLADGFAWLEGPVWFADQECLVFSDLPNDRVMRWTESGGVSTFLKPSGFANGHCRDRQGRLISCSHRERRITRREIDGEVSELAARFEGRRLNSPNDVICRSDGAVFFTDPLYGISTDYEGGKQVSELPARLYRIDPEDGALSVMSDALEGPNGLAFSPDETTLYVSETGARTGPDPKRAIWSFPVEADGRRLGPGRVFYRANPGFADGFRTDELGNLWTSAGDGAHCVDPRGTLLGKIRTPTGISNLAFGGRARSRLFLCGGGSLYAIYTNVRGAARP